MLRLSLLALLAALSASSVAREWVRAVALDRDGAIFYAEADDCPGAPRVFDLWYDGQFQDSCQTVERGGQLVAACSFRDARPIGQRGASVSARRMEGCAAAGVPSWHRALRRPVAPNRAAPDERGLLTVGGSRYEARFDRATGALYYFLNKNATAEAGRELNIVQPHVGAAVQVAIHHGKPGSLTAEPCSGQGYWNPTQAGAICAYPADSPPLGAPPAEGGSVPSCDGGPCAPGRAYRAVDWGWFRVRNFDYGPDYPGPPGALDDLSMAVRAVDHGDFLELEYRIRPARDIGVSAVQLPTYYLAHQFSSVAAQGLGALALPASAQPQPLRLPDGWASFAMDHPVYGRQALTVQTTLGAAFEAARVPMDSQAPNVSLTDLYGRVNYSYTLAARLSAGVELVAWALVVPAGPDATVGSPFGRTTVTDLLEAAREHYRRTQAALPITPDY